MVLDMLSGIPVRVLPLIVGFLLDTVVGDPRWIPHPVRWIGSLITYMERLIRRHCGRSLIAGGVLLAVLVPLVSAAICVLVLKAAYHIGTVAGVAVESVLCCYMLAAGDLRKETMSVYEALKPGGIGQDGRKTGRSMGVCGETGGTAHGEMRDAASSEIIDGIHGETGDGVMCKVGDGTRSATGGGIHGEAVGGAVHNEAKGVVSSETEASVRGKARDSTYGEAGGGTRGEVGKSIVVLREGRDSAVCDEAGDAVTGGTEDSACGEDGGGSLGSGSTGLDLARPCGSSEGNGGIELARQRVAMVVGRDTGRLDRAGIIRADVETVAENTSDGVTAPLIYMALGGAAGGVMYKAVNTLDSMVGYKNERFLELGRASARLDDLLNLIPSRITALCMMAAAWLLGYDVCGAYRIWRRDRRKHASPNSAQCEAVCAGALGIRLAGDAWYFGKLVKKEYIGDALREIEAYDIVRANRLMTVTSCVMWIMCVCLRVLVLRLMA